MVSRLTAIEHDSYTVRQSLGGHATPLNIRLIFNGMIPCVAWPPDARRSGLYDCRANVYLFRSRFIGEL